MNAYITPASYCIFKALSIVPQSQDNSLHSRPPLKTDKIYHPTPPQKTPLKSHWPQRSEV